LATYTGDIPAVSEHERQKILEDVDNRCYYEKANSFTKQNKLLHDLRKSRMNIGCSCTKGNCSNKKCLCVNTELECLEDLCSCINCKNPKNESTH